MKVIKEGNDVETLPVAHDYPYEDNSGQDWDDFDDEQGEFKADFKVEDEAPLDLTADFEEIQRIVKDEIKVDPSSEVQTIKDIPQAPNAPMDITADDDQDVMTWKSAQQLIIFRKNAMDIADEFVKASRLRLESVRERNVTIRDWKAYNTGKEAAKDIDVRRKRIKGGKGDGSGS